MLLDAQGMGPIADRGVFPYDGVRLEPRTVVEAKDASACLDRT